MIRQFGSNEYGDKNNFSTICKKCGREVNLVPTHYYGDNMKLEKITLEVRCVCGTKYGATIHEQ